MEQLVYLFINNLHGYQWAESASECGEKGHFPEVMGELFSFEREKFAQSERGKNYLPVTWITRISGYWPFQSAAT